MDSPWRSPGDWLKAALHMHTTNSDGELAPRALARHYGRAGYDVVALTDHWHRSEAPSSPDLVVLPGVELNCLLPEDRDGHVLGIGIERDPAELAGERRDLAATGDWIVDAGGVAYLAHPYWTGARAGAHRASAVRDRASRCSTPAASSRSAAGSRRCTGTSSSRTAASARRSSPTTAITPGSTRITPGRGSAPRATARASSTPCAPAASTAAPDRCSTTSRRPTRESSSGARRPGRSRC